MSLRTRVSRLEQRATPGADDHVMAIILTAPGRTARGYSSGGTSIMRMDGETDEALARRIEEMSGSGIRLWGAIA